MPTKPPLSGVTLHYFPPSPLSFSRSFSFSVLEQPSMREGGGAVHHVVLPAPPLLSSSLCPSCRTFCLLTIYAAAVSSCFFPPRLSVILRFFACSPLSNFRTTLPPHALTMDTGAFNVGQWNKSERLPSPSHCILLRALLSFSSI